MLDKVGLDLATMLARKDKVVKTLTGGVRALMKGNKVTAFTGLGTITEPGKVRVQPKEDKPIDIGAEHIVIATGSVPINLPSMPFDGKTVVSSTEHFASRSRRKNFSSSAPARSVSSSARSGAASAPR